MTTKGIILAGGRGTRLYPMTHTFSKQLLPVYDKPMIYYPLSTLMLAGIRDILLISTPHDLPKFEALLGDGSNWGINLHYQVQDEPKGLPQAFTLGKEFIDGNDVCLILGDNLFYGKLDFLRNGLENNNGGTIFSYRVENPQDYGVVDFDKEGNVLGIEEKPVHPKSHYAIPGIYIFDKNAPDIAADLKPSKRGELEIVDMHRHYLAKKDLKVVKIGRGVAWLDTGTPESLMDASNFIHAIEKRQGRKIACLDEIALMMNFISIEEYAENVAALPNCDYKKYCEMVLKEDYWE